MNAGVHSGRSEGFSSPSAGSWIGLATSSPSSRMRRYRAECAVIESEITANTNRLRSVVFLLLLLLSYTLNVSRDKSSDRTNLSLSRLSFSYVWNVASISAFIHLRLIKVQYPEFQMKYLWFYISVRIELTIYGLIIHENNLEKNTQVTFVRSLRSLSVRMCKRNQSVVNYITLSSSFFQRGIEC